MDRQLSVSEPAVLDREELLARCMGNLEFAERVVTKFLECFDEHLVELEQELLSENAEAIARVAHRAKGASANVAAPALREQAAGIEEAARRQQLSEIPPRLAQLRSEWSRFVDCASSLGSSAGATC